MGQAERPDDGTLELVQLRDEQGLTWDQIVKVLGERLGLTKEGIRSRYRRFKERRGEYDPETESGPKIAPGVSMKQRANEMVLTAKSPLITSLDDLVAFCEVDLDTWYVDRYKLNAWPVGIREEFKDITFNQGVMDGSIKSTGEVAFGQLVQVTAWLYRIDPEAIYPALQPVAAGSIYQKPPEPSGGAVRSLVWEDTHFGYLKAVQDAQLDPFHDRRVLDLILQVAEAVAPDRVDIMGDFLDLPEWSQKFQKRPEFYWTTQPAVIEAHWWLAQLRAALPDIPIYLHEGNHEVRLRSAVETHLIAAYELRSADALAGWPALSVPNLLGLDGLGIEWVGDYPDDVAWMEGTRVEHGYLHRKGGTARAILAESDENVIFGHTHGVEAAGRTLRRRGNRRSIVAMSFGCACRVDGIVPARGKRNDWVQGFGVVDAVGDAQTSTVIVVEDGRAVWDRQVFEARDRVEELRELFPEWGW